ncbi:Rpn family recombination-promoting nuclease/putative transposase [Crocosphaera sp. Alani8]|uniref:Rpn family recombination-promoting nuclease/putative transposase n=1 Tax=Crocosphaera sp. Alani8 TaxID=3038952 RepID=UPI00313B36C9
MKTDSIFYQIFQTFPGCFFDLLNLPENITDEYQFSSVEIKQLAFRIDGVFIPQNLQRLIYFVEVQFQKDQQFYSRFFSEIFLYLHQTKLTNNWQGVVIYPNRQTETKNTSRYQEILDSDRVKRIYLSELSNTESIGIKTLKLIISPQKEAIEQGKNLIKQVKQEFSNAEKQENILQLIETILVYKLPKISRQEIEKMFSLSDLRETKVYQEALEEGIEQGKQEGELKTKMSTIPRLIALGLTVEQIAQAVDLDIEQVRNIIQSDS